MNSESWGLRIIELNSQSWGLRISIEFTEFILPPSERPPPKSNPAKDSSWPNSLHSQVPMVPDKGVGSCGALLLGAHIPYQPYDKFGKESCKLIRCVRAGFFP